MTSEELPRPRYQLERVRRHLRWARTQGLARLVEEDELDPLSRLRGAVRRWGWRRTHEAPPGSAVPVWLVGVQRSGTNMIVRGLEASPEFDVFNENDSRAFHRFRLRPDHEIRELVLRSRHRYALFKPLCDSHRVDDLLDMRTPAPGRAIWAWRRVDGRVRSALAKFGDVNLVVLREIAAGVGGHRWQAQRLSPGSLDLIRSFDWDSIGAAEAAALFWLVRNDLYFELGLDARDDVTLASYDAFVADPEGAMRPLCSFLGLPYDLRLVAHVGDRRDAAAPTLELDPRIRALCDEMERRLGAATRGKGARAAAPHAPPAP